MYEQIIIPKQPWPYVGGWCEGFVSGSFGESSAPQKDKNGNWFTTGPYSSAMSAWNANVGGGNHPNEQPPKGLYVPVYFSLGSTNAGHSAIVRPDGTVLSSTQGGWHASGAVHPNLKHLIDTYARFNNGCTYLGWKEFAGNARVIKRKENDMVQDNDLDFNVLSQTFKNMTGRSLSRAEYNGQVGRKWQDVLITFQGSNESNTWFSKAANSGKASVSTPDVDNLIRLSEQTLNAAKALKK